jgi:probable HAF family extracellular repeat protein
MAKSRSRAPSTALACLVIVSSSVAAVQAEEPDAAHARRPRYELIDLGLPYYSVTAGINNKGEIVGSNQAAPNDPQYAFLWKNGHVQYIGAVGGTDSQGVAVNNQGEVVGSAQNAQQTWIGMVYSGGQSEALPIEIAYGLNNLGQIVGSSNVPPPAPHVMESTAAQLYQDGTVTNLGSLGGYISAAFGINDRGEIVGYSDTGPDTTSPLHAFLYRDGMMTDLGTFGGQNSDAMAINSHGVIAGAADLPPTSTTTPEHAFIYRSGRMIDLGVVGSDVSSSGWAINDYDEVVGFTSTSTNTTSGTMFAMVYTHGKMYHLQDLIDLSSSALASHVNLYEATGINNDGWIAVNGYDTNDITPPNQFFGLPRSYLMRPVR